MADHIYSNKLAVALQAPCYLKWECNAYLRFEVVKAEDN